MRNRASSSSSQSSVARLSSCVRLALVTSVTCKPPAGPPVRFQSTQLSIVPHTASPRSAAARTPSTLSRIHCSFSAEKYVAGGRPVRSMSSVRYPFQCANAAVGAHVLPHDRVVIRPAVAWIPHHGRLTLVGHAYGRQVLPRQPCVGQCTRDHRSRARDDFNGIVLDPARLRQDLPVLELAHGHRRSVVVEDDESGARRALVQRSHVTRHVGSASGATEGRRAPK